MVKVINILDNSEMHYIELPDFSISAILNREFQLPLTNPEEDHADCPPGYTVESMGNIIVLHNETEQRSIFYVLQ